MGFTTLRNVVLKMIVIVLIMAIVDCDPSASDLQIPLSKWSVHISNELMTGDLFAHCKSKDDDLGPQNIASGQVFSWSFKENIFSSTMYWCYFSSSHGHAEFEVFWKEGISHNWLANHCAYSDCIWSARDDGIHLLNLMDVDDDFKNDWISP